MKQNLGKLDRILRFLFGVWIVSWVLPTVKTEWLWWVLLVVAVIALLESFLAHCNLHSWFGVDNKKQ